MPHFDQRHKCIPCFDLGDLFGACGEALFGAYGANAVVDVGHVPHFGGALNLESAAMPNLVYFDHIEVHVSDVPAYATFLTRVFSGGRWKHIGDGGAAMFISPSGLRIEVKATSAGGTQPGRGFCLPCIRLEGARHHIEEVLGLEIVRSADNPDGPVHFFRDPEGIEWHAKDYAHMDAYVDW